MKSSMSPLTLDSVAEMKYTPERVGSGSRLFVTISTTAEVTGVVFWNCALLVSDDTSPVVFPRWIPEM